MSTKVPCFNPGFTADDIHNNLYFIFQSKCRGFFDWQLLIDVMKTTFKKRPNFERLTIWCLLLPVTAVTFDTGK